MALACRLALSILMLLVLLPASRPAVVRAQSSADGISWPTAGSIASGRVEVRGTAGSAGPSFRSFRLEFGAGQAPAVWQLIGPERDRGVAADVLGLWETDGLAPGEYTLRLVVFDEAGHDVESRVTVDVVAMAAPGSPTVVGPTVTPTATPSPGPAGEPSPTATPEEMPSATPSEPPSPGATRPPAPEPPAPDQAFRCPMLYYHEVPAQAAFAAQLAAFLQAGYRPVTMGQLVNALDGWSEPPPGCLVLTFDDGLSSQMSGALPVLLRYQVPATFFVMSYFRDGVHRYMTPDDFRVLRDAGMEIGSHTLNHASLPGLLRRTSAPCSRS